LLDRDLEFKLRAQVDMVATAIASLLSLLLAAAGAGVWALLAAIVANAAFRSLLLAWRKPWIVVPSLAFGRVKDLVYYGGQITLGGALLVMAGKMVHVIAGPSLGAHLLGLYAVAGGLAALPMSKIMPIVQQTMYPAYARLCDHPEMAQTYLTKSLQVSALVMFPVLIGMACLSQHFVTIVFGAKWMPIVLPLALFAASTPLKMVAQVCYPALNALGHARAVLAINFTMLLLLAVGAYFAVDRGLMAVVFVWLIATPIVTAMTLLFVRSLLGVSLIKIAKAVWPASAGCLAMAVPLLAANTLLPDNAGIFRLLVEIAVGAAIYLLVIFLFFRTLIDEVHSNIFSRT
jgi:O-antigen/teichoic acid export membrane protein